jgi:hypothetical protein
MIEKACINASHGVIPAWWRLSPQAAVRITYTTHSPLAVSVSRGVIFESFIGPGVSALSMLRPPKPSSGRIATARTTTPRPPIQCMKVRQKLIDSGRWSSPESTVAPVAVSPETASK